MGTDPQMEPGTAPATEAGRRLLAQLDSVSRTPYSGISFPGAEDDILAIEHEAAEGAARREAGLRTALDTGRLERAYERATQVEDKHTPEFWEEVVAEYDRLTEHDPFTTEPAP